MTQAETTEAEPMLRPANIQRRDAILAVAHDVFLESGYEGASMSQIAARLGGSKGTLYSYFDNKAALFAALVSESCTRNRAAIFDIPADSGFDAGLYAIARGYLQVVMSNWATRMFQIIAAEAPRWPELATIFYESGPAASIAQLSRYLADHGADHGLAIPDSVEAAECFLTLCRGSRHLRRILGLISEADVETLDREARRAVEAFRTLYAA